jgi:predicted phosphodiesterase
VSVELRIAVFSDVHGNLPALTAVLAHIAECGPFDAMIAAGDYCLKGPDPAQALDLVMERSSVVLKGNTDRDIVQSGASVAELSRKKQNAILWARRQLGHSRIATLDGLAFDARIVAPDGTSLRVVHANPHDLEERIFPSWTLERFNEVFGGLDDHVLVFGHLHIPFERRFGDRRLFDVASAGLPQDGDRRAAWGQFNWSPDAGWQGCIHRVPYDHGDTVLRILDSRMPSPERRIRDLLRASYY